MKIEIVGTPKDETASSAKYVVNRLIYFQDKHHLEEDDELWVLLDTDHYVTYNHLPSYIQTIKEAKQRNFRVAVSKPCFEFWLLLHHVEVTHEVLALPNADAVEKALREALGEYNKTKLKAEHYPLATVAKAFLRAAQLDQNTVGGEIPETNTSRVYLLWQAIVAKATSLELPLELQVLRNQENLMLREEG